MPKFLVMVETDFKLWKYIEAEDEEEAKRIAEKLEPDEFENFHDFYEWLGHEWKRLRENVKIERVVAEGVLRRIL